MTNQLKSKKAQRCNDGTYEHAYYAVDNYVWGRIYVCNDCNFTIDSADRKILKKEGLSN